MKRIIIHWSAGTYVPNGKEYLDYHYIVDDKGKIFNGVYSPLDNENCYDGKYAAHTGGGNTGSIGIAMACMFGYKGRNNIGKYPMTKVQFDACMRKVAELCKTYGIRITEDTVLTHYEFGLKHPNTTSAGKIDINFLPFYPQMASKDVGNYIRNCVAAYI